MRQPSDLSGKIWDEDALLEWEAKDNGGRKWEGRQHINLDTTQEENKPS